MWPCHIIYSIFLFASLLKADSKTSKEANKLPSNSTIGVPRPRGCKKTCKTEFHPDDDSSDFCKESLFDRTLPQIRTGAHVSWFWSYEQYAITFYALPVAVPNSVHQQARDVLMQMVLP